MSQKLSFLAGLVGSVIFLAVSSANAGAPLVVAQRSDVASLDPYAIDEGLHLDIASNVYEPLVRRNAQRKLEGALATAWKSVSPTVWRFTLRRGVRFHDGAALTADDVVFSFERATAPGANIPALVAPIKVVRAIDSHTVDIELHRAMPQFPESLPYWLIMSRKWCVQHGAGRVQDAQGGKTSWAATHANGTGPFRVAAREPGVATTYILNQHYWGKRQGNVDTVRFVPIPDDAARAAALLDGSVDIVNPLPQSSRAAVLARADLALQEGPELRVLFLGMDQASSRLDHSDVVNANPFADPRVRRAVALGIDVRALVKDTMQGAATPVGVLVPRQVFGYAEALDHPVQADPGKARELLREAGYPQGFKVTLDCPNNRYVNDAKVCGAVANQLDRIGIQVQVEAQDKSAFFKKLFAHESSFYLLGAATGTGDAYSVLQPLMGSGESKDAGSLNLGGYHNPRVNALLREADSESNPQRRLDLMAEIQRIHQQETGHVPLYQQWLSWGKKQHIQVVQTPEDGMPWRYIRVDQKNGEGKAG